jgi:hypothetical protein
LARRIADRIFDELDAENETVLVSRNGDDLTDPAVVGIRLTGRVSQKKWSAIENVVHGCLANLEALSEWLLTMPPLDRFRRPQFPLE